MSELLGAGWRRSVRCVGEHHCVEVADLGSDAIGLRNSQRPEQSLIFSKQIWHDFLQQLKAGDFRS